MLNLNSRVWTNTSNIENSPDIKENCKLSPQLRSTHQRMLFSAILRCMQDSSAEVNRFPADFAQPKLALL